MKKLLTILLLMIPLTGAAMENKIKFDNETYNLSVNTENGYNYYPKGENADNWHSKITIKKLPSGTDPVEYNTAYFQKDSEFTYGRRFYNSDGDARKKAIEFAEKYNKKYMELVDKEAPKYKL